jgi:hypothetical protein
MENCRSTRSLAVQLPTVRPGANDAVAYCAQRYRSYDAASGTNLGTTAIGISAPEAMPRGVAGAVRGPAHRRFGRLSPSYLVAPGRGTPCRSLMGTQLFFRRWFRGAPWTFRTLPAEQEPSLT